MKEKDLYKLRSLKVYKSNAMIQKSRFTLSLQQQKMMLYIISKINRDDSEFNWYELSLPEFCDIAGINVSGGKTYRELKAALKTLSDKSMWIESEDGKREVLVRWIQNVIIDKENNVIKAKIDDTLKPYLLELQGSYTKYELAWALHCKSKYTVRLYEYIKSKQYDDSTQYTWTVTGEDLRKRMDGETYDRWFDFKKYALLPAVQEIDNFSDIFLSCDIARAVDGELPEVTFTVSTKDKETKKSIRAWIEDEMNGNIGLDGEYQRKLLESHNEKKNKANRQKQSKTSTSTSGSTEKNPLPDTIVIRRKV